MSPPPPKSGRGGLITAAVSMLMAAGLCSPAVAAFVLYRNPDQLQRSRTEILGRDLPFGSAGAELIKMAGGVAERMPTKDQTRASFSARTAMAMILGRMHLALAVWLAALLSVLAAAFGGLANRQVGDPTLTWSSPLAAWLAKRGVLLAVVLLLVGPALTAWAPIAVATALLVALAAAAACCTYAFARNLPARL